MNRNWNHYIAECVNKSNDLLRNVQYVIGQNVQICICNYNIAFVNSER